MSSFPSASAGGGGVAMRSSGFSTEDGVGAIVADIGSFAARIGFAGDDSPKSYFPSLVGLPHNPQPGEKDVRFDLHNFVPNMRIASTMKDGTIDDWNTFEKLWEHANKTSLKSNLAETPVFMTEKPYTSSATRRKLSELMFERFSVPAFFLSKDSVLSCYSCGKTTGPRCRCRMQWIDNIRRC
jgi:actin-related protein